QVSTTPMAAISRDDTAVSWSLNGMRPTDGSMLADGGVAIGARQARCRCSHQRRAARSSPLSLVVNIPAALAVSRQRYSGAMLGTYGLPRTGASINLRPRPGGVHRFAWVWGHFSLERGALVVLLCLVTPTAVGLSQRDSSEATRLNEGTSMLFGRQARGLT